MASEKPEHEDELVSDHAECQMAKEKSPLTKKGINCSDSFFFHFPEKCRRLKCIISSRMYMDDPSKQVDYRKDGRLPRERERWWIERLGFGASVQGGLLVSCHIHAFFLKL